MGRMEDDKDQSVRQGLGIIAGGCTGQDAPSLLHGPVKSPAFLPSGRLPADHGRQGIGRPHGGGQAVHQTNLCLKVLANGSEMLVALQARIKDFLRCA